MMLRKPEVSEGHNNTNAKENTIFMNIFSHFSKGCV